MSFQAFDIRFVVVLDKNIIQKILIRSLKNLKMSSSKLLRLMCAIDNSHEQFNKITSVATSPSRSAAKFDLISGLDHEAMSLKALVLVNCYALNGLSRF